MGDIVRTRIRRCDERIYKCPDHGEQDALVTCSVCLMNLEEGASKVASLRTRIKELEAGVNKAKHGEIQALTKMVNAQTERDRYKGALEEIAEYEWATVSGTVNAIAHNMKDIAKTALEGNDG